MPNESERFEQIELALPGLELDGAGTGRPASAMRKAVQVTLAELHELQLLKPRHTAIAQLALELADAVDSGVRHGRASAAAMAAGQLRDTLLALPEPEEAKGDGTFEQLLEELRRTPTMEEKPNG